MVLIPDGYAQVTLPLRHASLTRPAAIVFGVQNQGDVTAAVLAENIRTAVIAPGSFQDLMDSNVSIGPVEVALGTGLGPTQPGIATGADPGAANAVTTPPNLALLVNKNTATPGREGRGRMYIPWCIASVDVSEAGVISGAALVSRQNILSAWLTALEGQFAPMVVLHSVYGVLNPIPSPVEGLTPQALVGTQRRRLGR